MAEFMDSDNKITDLWIICDIDGTLADDNHRTNFIPDWDAYNENCDKDSLYNNVAQLIKELSIDHPLLIITERSEKNRAKTEQWLSANGIYYDELLMRPDYSPLNNSDLKWDLVVKFIGSEEKVLSDVLCVFEDNDKTVEMYRNKGLTVLQPRA